MNIIDIYKILNSFHNLILDQLIFTTMIFIYSKLLFKFLVKTINILKCLYNKLLKIRIYMDFLFKKNLNKFKTIFKIYINF